MVVYFQIGQLEVMDRKVIFIASIISIIFTICLFSRQRECFCKCKSKTVHIQWNRSQELDFLMTNLAKSDTQQNDPGVLDVLQRFFIEPPSPYIGKIKKAHQTHQADAVTKITRNKVRFNVIIDKQGKVQCTGLIRLK